MLIILIMRMLGEMATAHPSTGSFADYAGLAMGDWARFLVGWLYWYFWVIVLAVEAAAGAGIIQEWLPGVPIWLSSLVLMIALTATNLVSVRAFGEFEFWFASIKVVAILAFIAIALVLVILQPRINRLLASGAVGSWHERGVLPPLAVYATGIYGGYEHVIGRFGAIVQAGGIVSRGEAASDSRRLYSRFGWRYHVNDRLWTTFAIRAYGLRNANALEIGVGHRFGRSSADVQ